MHSDSTSASVDNDLTIISVCAQDKHLLDINYDLTTSLNDANEFVWFVVDNTPKLSENRVDRNDDRFVVMDGVDFEEKGHWGSRSYHHARALNLALPNVKTRFVLFLDPDCFIVRKNWIKDVLEFMRLSELSFFGVPCHPRKSTAYRYFPYVACLFIDLNRVNRRDLDFTPEIDELIIMQNIGGWTLVKWLLSNIRLKKKVKELINVDKAYILDILKRRFIYQFIAGTLHIGNAWIGTSGDTGSRIYRRFINDPIHKYEYVTPVWRIEKMAPHVTIMEKIKQKLAPDALSVIPKRKGYFTNVTFSDLGMYDVESAFNCESYLWRGTPFCFHVRSIGLQNLSTKFFRESINSFMKEPLSDSGNHLE